MTTDTDAGQLDTAVLDDAADTAAADADDASVADADAHVADTSDDGSDAASGAADDNSADTGAGDAADQGKPNAKKTVEKLTGRIGHLTKTLHQKDEEIAAERRKSEALEALLNRGADGTEPPPATPPAAADTPRPGTPEFDRLVDERATVKARQEAFDRDCNSIFDSGEQKHGAEFKEAVTNLNALGVMSPALVEAAMATDTPADVIHALGTDLDEAARITALPPIRMAAEIVKLSAKLAAPKAGQVSRVPPPINPVGGKTAASLDVYDPDISMEEFERRRAAQGSRFARKR